MDAVPCGWDGGKGQEAFVKSRPMGEALTKLAKLMARVEHEQEARAQKPQAGAAPCQDQALRKPHRCGTCAQKFALPSTLQLHKCLGAGPVSAEPPDVPDAAAQPQQYQHRRRHADGPYACAPCGRDFSHKQELLYHQQAGGCQPAALGPAASSPATTQPAPSHDALLCPPTRSSFCQLCNRAFRSAAGLANHQRFWHPDLKPPRNSKPHEVTRSLGREAAVRRRAKGQQFPCRSCDKVFAQTALLHQHRNEVHGRKKWAWREHRPAAKKARRGTFTYPCSVCGKVFLHQVTRWYHLRTHNLPLQNQKVKVGRPPKFRKAKSKTAPRQRTQGPGDEPDGREEDTEFPCPSCSEVFASLAALRDHDEVHQPPRAARSCSVCSQEMSSSKEGLVEKVYHCAPCRRAFLTLGAFLQHCQLHLIDL
ncbi:zinc finger protein 470-like [Denticeps clupeoides]|uniref:C2H2-type domain-containing protein n=1 Tax=Denticeps clupeoides TaxID=299321 RepID=A0AAY4BX43_9TELE|nr:zinc finger protein 470-like [Denticeps clupeoides]XP_028848460.1 zinc finger protein 470-like [Denticeps clupeoides]